MRFNSFSFSFQEFLIDVRGNFSPHKFYALLVVPSTQRSAKRWCLAQRTDTWFSGLQTFLKVLLWMTTSICFSAIAPSFLKIQSHTFCTFSQATKKHMSRVLLKKRGSTQTVCHIRYWSGLVGGLATMEHVMLVGARKLTPYSTLEFQRAYCVFRAAQSELATRAMAKGEAKYHVRPKLHQLGHVTWHWLPKNPRYYQVYCDEDFVARTKRVAEKSHPAHMSRLTLFRYILQFCLRVAGDLWEFGWRGKRLKPTCARSWTCFAKKNLWNIYIRIYI